VDAAPTAPLSPDLAQQIGSPIDALDWARVAPYPPRIRAAARGPPVRCYRARANGSGSRPRAPAGPPTWFIAFKFPTALVRYGSHQFATMLQRNLRDICSTRGTARVSARLGDAGLW
jgi:hypothetical protein